jgi:hypothetical protein
MGEAPEEVDPVALRKAFEDLEGDDPVAFEVFRRRQLVPGERQTLRAIGEELGVSRERVRQLEARFALKLKRSVAEDEGHPLHRAAAFLEERLGPFSRAEVLRQAIEELDQGENVLEPEHRVLILLRLAGPYEQEDDWCTCRPKLEKAAEVLDQLGEDGPVPLDVAVASLADLGVSPEDAEAWLRRSKAYMVIEGHLARRGASMGDRGVSVLALRGEPMTLEEIFEILDEDRSFASFKNQMQADSRVLRRGLKRYGLEEWGGEEYTTVTDEMIQEIDRSGGRVDLDELAEGLSRRFGVSPSSVRMYSQGAQFHVDGDGGVSVAPPGDAPATKPLPLTRGCFRLPAGWSFRRIVDHDVLRGSGSAIPLGFAKELGLQPGDSLRLETPFGLLTCSWPSHMAHVGSLRAAAEAYRAVEGDYLFIVSLGEGRADVLHAAAGEWQKLKGVSQLAKRCGCDGSREEDIAASLGVERAKSGALRTRIRQQLVQRGESDLSGLVEDDEDLLEALVDL